MKLSTLTYHDVVHGPTDVSGLETPGARSYKLDWSTFREHLDRLAQRNIGPPVRADHVIEGTAPDPAWALTFDDGGTSAVEVADELARRGWHGHFLVMTSRIATPGFVDQAGIRRIASQGHVIGTHSVSHPNLAALASPEAMLEEWRASAAVLSELVDAPVIVGSVPGGWYSHDVGRAAAAAGLKLLFTSEPVREVSRIDGCLVVGRLAVRRGGSSARVAALAAGSPLAWNVGRATWTARKVAKGVGGRRYQAIRDAWFGRR